MNRLPHLRVIIDPRANTGIWNMAVDETLLQSAIDRDVATLRWYRWCEPTVSLGYFQREDELASDMRLADLPRVRRLSGGGTLVHDHELTYSLSLPASQRLVERPMDLYKVVHQAFIDVLRDRGLEMQFRGSTTKRQDEPLLCFARQDEHDLVIGHHKVLGSAQRRRRGAILQHGGFLLGASVMTPELPGVNDLARKVDLTDLAWGIGSALTREVADTFDLGPLSPVEHELAAPIIGNVNESDL